MLWQISQEEWNAATGASECMHETTLEEWLAGAKQLMQAAVEAHTKHKDIHEVLLVLAENFDSLVVEILKLTKSAKLTNRDLSTVEALCDDFVCLANELAALIENEISMDLEEEGDLEGAAAIRLALHNRNELLREQGSGAQSWAMLETAMSDVRVAAMHVASPLSDNKQEMLDGVLKEISVLHDSFMQCQKSFMRQVQSVCEDQIGFAPLAVQLKLRVHCPTITYKPVTDENSLVITLG